MFVFLIFVLAKVWAVKVEETMTELVAGNCLDSQATEMFLRKKCKYLPNLIIFTISEYWKAFFETKAGFRHHFLVAIARSKIGHIHLVKITLLCKLLLALLYLLLNLPQFP